MTTHDPPIPRRLAVILFFLALSAASCKKDVLFPEAVTPVTTGTDGTLYDVLFLNDRIGFIAGGDRYFRSDLLTTTDGGQTWELFHFDGDAEKAVYKLAHVGEKVYAVAYDGKFITKVSPHSPWQYVQTAWWQWYESLVFPEPDHGYIAVNMGFASGAIVQIDSFGNLFKVDSFPCSISDLCFTGDGAVYACGYGIVLKTTDKGASWQIQQIDGDNFKAICAVGEKDIWAAGNNGSIIHSGNGGETWEKQRNGNDPFLQKYHLTGIFFTDKMNGYATGENGLLLKTTDGGAHWAEFERFTDRDLMAVSRGPGGSLWVTGNNGVVFKITE